MLGGGVVVVALGVATGAPGTVPGASFGSVLAGDAAGAAAGVAAGGGAVLLSLAGGLDGAELLPIFEKITTMISRRINTPPRMKRGFGFLLGLAKNGAAGPPG